VTSLTPCSDRLLTSCRIEAIGLDLSRPLVKGTIQYVHILSQPRMIDLKSKIKSCNANLHYMMAIALYKDKDILTNVTDLEQLLRKSDIPLNFLEYKIVKIMFIGQTACFTYTNAVTAS